MFILSEESVQPVLVIDIFQPSSALQLSRHFVWSNITTIKFAIISALVLPLKV